MKFIVFLKESLNLGTNQIGELDKQLGEDVPRQNNLGRGERDK